MDNRTMIVMLIIILLLCSLLMIISSFSRRRLSGSRSLSIWLVLQAAGMILLSTQGYSPIFLGILSSNILIFASSLFLTRGLFQSMQVQFNKYFFITYFILYALAHSLFTYILPLTYIRVALISSLLAFLYFFTVYACIKNMKRSGTPFFYVIAFILSADGLFYITRTVFAFVNPMNSIFNSDFMTSITFLLLDFTVIGITLSFLLLQNQKLIAQRIDMEAAIKEGEDRYSTTLASIGDAVITTDIEGRIIFMNSAAEGLTGWKFNDAQLKQIDEVFNIINENTKMKVESPVAKVIENGLIAGLANHTVLVRKDGGNIPIDDSGAPIKDRDGKITGVVLIFRDISERRLAEKVKAFQAQILSEVYEAVFSSDKNYMITYWNQAAEKMFGWTKEETLGKNSGELLKPKVEGSTRDKERSTLWSAGHWEGETQYIRKDGTYFFTEVNSTLLKDADGKDIGQVVVARDITERKKTEQALKKSEQNYRSLVNSIPDTSIMLFDGDLRFQVVGGDENEKNNLGKSQIEGKTLREAYPKDVAELFEPIYQKALLGLATTFEMSYGQYVYLQQTIPIKDSEGQIFSAMQISTNITERKKIEEALHTTLRRFYLILSSLRSGILLVTDDNRVEFVNQAFCEVFGLKESPDELLRISANEMIEKIRPFYRYPDAAVDRIREIVGTGRPVKDEDVGMSSGRAYLRDFVPIRIGEKSYGRMWVHFDITERKEAEEVIKESEERFRTIAEALPVLISISRSEDSTIVFTNTAYNEVFGFSKGEIIGRKGPDVYYDPVDRAKMLELINQKGFVSNYQIKAKKSDGTPFWILSSVKPINYDGKPSILGASIDITERKRMEEELREARDYLEKLIQNANAPIIVWNTEMRITRFNGGFEELTGWMEKELLGENLSRLFPDESRDKSMDEIGRILKGEHWKYVEIPILCKDGGIKLVLWNSANVYTENGTVLLSTIAQGMDITERKQAEIELQKAKDAAEKAYQTKSLFIANMSHELRTPLNSILGYAQLLRKPGDLNEKQLDSITVMYNSGHHLLNMINDLLDMSKIEAGQMTLEQKEFSLPDLLTKVADIIHVETEEKNLEFNFEPQSDVPGRVIGDEKRLYQILLNLLSNAVKFTEKGRVFLKVGRTGNNQLRFEVEDTGIGIPQEQMDIIFDSFQQLDTGQAKTKGTGLGLTISRNLVKLMGSELFVKSEIGKGSTFWFDMDMKLLKDEFTKIDPMTFGKKEEIDALEEGIPVPPAEELKALYFMAKVGDIVNIRKYIEKAEAEHPEWKSFTSKLKLLSKNINLTGIKNLIRKYEKD